MPSMKRAGRKPKSRKKARTGPYDDKPSRVYTGADWNRMYMPASQAQVIRANAGEKKLLDTPIAAAGANGMITSVNTNDDILPVNLIRPGNGYYNRVGRKVFLKSLRLRGYVNGVWTQPADGDLSGTMIRLVVILDRAPNSGTIPTWETIFASTTQDGTETGGITYNLKADNFGRFRILRDMQLIFNPKRTPLAAGDVMTQRLQLDEYIRLNNIVTQYSGDSSPQTIADIQANAIYVAFRTISAVTGESEYTITCNTRLRFSD